MRDGRGYNITTHAAPTACTSHFENRGPTRQDLHWHAYAHTLAHALTHSHTHSHTHSLTSIHSPRYTHVPETIPPTHILHANTHAHGHPTSSTMRVPQRELKWPSHLTPGVVHPCASVRRAHPTTYNSHTLHAFKNVFYAYLSSLLHVTRGNPDIAPSNYKLHFS